jgi:hypothetical protein
MERINIQEENLTNYIAQVQPTPSAAQTVYINQEKASIDTNRANNNAQKAASETKAKADREACIKGCDDPEEVIKQCDEAKTKRQAELDKAPPETKCYTWVKGTAAARPFKCGKRCLTVVAYGWNPRLKPGGICSSDFQKSSVPKGCEEKKPSGLAINDSILLNSNGIRILNSFTDGGTGSDNGSTGSPDTGSGADNGSTGSSSSSSSSECETPGSYELIARPTYASCSKDQEFNDIVGFGTFDCAEKCEEARAANPTYEYSTYDGYKTISWCVDCKCGKKPKPIPPPT